MTPIVDATDELKSPRVSWQIRGDGFSRQFSEAIRRIRLGVYASVHVNDSTEPIWDRNKGGKGKIIVRAKSVCLKYGKFETGLAARNLDNYRHFHRRLADGGEEAGIFPSVLHLLLVLDLTNVDAGGPNAAAVFEQYWNRRIELFLRSNELLHNVQIKGCESRHLTRMIKKGELQPVLEEVSDRVHTAAKALAAPRQERLAARADRD